MPPDGVLKEWLVPGEHFVELGCGTGEIIGAVAQLYQQSIGVDLNPAKVADNGSERPWTFVESDLNERFPLADGWADCIVANQVIEHVYNPFHFAREAYRSLRPGGRLVVTTPNIRYLKNIWWIVFSGHGPRTAGANTLDGEWDDGHIHYFTHRDLLELFRSVGFARVQSMALVGMYNANLARRSIHRLRHLWLTREFLAGNILLVADK